MASPATVISHDRRRTCSSRPFHGKPFFGISPSAVLGRFWVPRCLLTASSLHVRSTRNVEMWKMGNMGTWTLRLASKNGFLPYTERGELPFLPVVWGKCKMVQNKRSGYPQLQDHSSIAQLVERPFFISVGVPSPFFPGILLSEKPHNTLGKQIRCLKRTMVERKWTWNQAQEF